MRALRLIAPTLAAIVMAGCDGCAERAPGSSGSAAAGTAPAPPRLEDRVLLSFFDELSTCDVEHRGHLIDLGGPADALRVDAPLEPSSATELEGSSFRAVGTQDLRIRFVLAEPQRLFVAARLAPRSARSVTMLLDGMSVGAARFKRGDQAIRIVEGRVSAQPFDAGEHEVTLRFSGPRGADVRALVDWVRVGFPDELKETYGAPVLADVTAPAAALGKTPQRAFSLRMPSVVRCGARVAPRTALRTSGGLLGAGEGEAEIVARVEGEAPVSLQRVSVKGGDSASWTSLEIPLEPFANKTVFFEFAARAGTHTSRILFGEPALVSSTVEPAGVPPSQVVVLVVLSGVDVDELPGYADRPTPGLDNLRRLSERATVFRAHRAATTRPTGSVATLLTALPADSLTLAHLGGPLPDRAPTLAERATQRNALTAFYTGVPHSFAPFALQRGFISFTASSPVEGDGKLPIFEAAKWLTQSLGQARDRSHLLVVHARGGHPPWVIDTQQLDLMPPDNYTGDVSPRRAAQQLAAIRKKKRFSELAPTAQTRLGALHHAALADQDRAIGDVLKAVADANLDDKVLLVVTADVASGLSRLFDETPPLEETRLRLPLYVVFPGGAHAQTEVRAVTDALDVAATLHRALGVELPKGAPGRDLAAVAQGLPLAGRALSLAVANDAHLVRMEDYALSPTGKLCDVRADPTCLYDQRAVFPLTAQLLVRLRAQAVARQPAPFERQNAQIDDATLSALRVWGAME